MQRWRRERPGRLHARAEMSPLDDMSLTAAIRTWGSSQRFSHFGLGHGDSHGSSPDWSLTMISANHGCTRIQMIQLECKNYQNLLIQSVSRWRRSWLQKTGNLGRVRQPWLVFHRSQGQVSEGDPTARWRAATRHDFWVVPWPTLINGMNHWKGQRYLSKIVGVCFYLALSIIFCT